MKNWQMFRANWKSAISYSLGNSAFEYRCCMKDCWEWRQSSMSSASLHCADETLWRQQWNWTHPLKTETCCLEKTNNYFQTRIWLNADENNRCTACIEPTIFESRVFFLRFRPTRSFLRFLLLQLFNVSLKGSSKSLESLFTWSASTELVVTSVMTWNCYWTGSWHSTKIVRNFQDTTACQELWPGARRVVFLHKNLIIFRQSFEHVIFLPLNLHFSTNKPD